MALGAIRVNGALRSSSSSSSELFTKDDPLPLRTLAGREGGRSLGGVAARSDRVVRLKRNSERREDISTMSLVQGLCPSADMQ